MKPSVRRLRITLRFLLAFAVAGFCWQTWCERVTERDYPAPGTLVDVGGHRLHFVIRGESTAPLVVIDAGLGGASYDMEPLQQKLASFCRVLCYDRAGYGWSDPGPAPRSNDRLVEELRRMLRNAGLPPPYLLVGHSMGGLNMRLYASMYPTEVKGLVLVDAYSRDAFPADTDVRQIPWLFRIGRLTSRLGTTRLAVPYYLPIKGETLSERVRRARAMKSRTTFIRTYCQEDTEPNWLDVRGMMRHLGDLPVTVLLAEQHLEKWPWWPTAQQTLLSISNDLQTTTVACGHSMHSERPEVVVAAVREMLNRIDRVDANAYGFEARKK